MKGDICRAMGRSALLRRLGSTALGLELLGCGTYSVLRFAGTELRTVLAVCFQQTVALRQARGPNLRDSRRQTFPSLYGLAHPASRHHPLLGLFIALALLHLPEAAWGGEAVLEVGKFSTAAPGSEFPDNWKPLKFKKNNRHTTYSLVRDGDVVVVQAVSQASASGMTREITINPRDYPIVQWRWKISNVLQKSDVTRKEGDDYPARLYITFAYDASQVGVFEKAKYETARLLFGQYPPIGAINYIWASKEPVGTVVPNAFTDRAKMIVLQSAGPLNTWVSEERNILEDYRRAFGEQSPVPMISGVALMTDTDNTGESATAYFGDIVFRAADPQPSSYRK